MSTSRLKPFSAPNVVANRPDKPVASRRLHYSAAPISVYALIMFLGSFAITGYRVFLEHHTFQIALVQLLKNPSLYPNDPYAVALSHYGSLLWPVVAWAAKLVPLEPLLFCLFFAERFFTLYGAGRLARAFAPNSILAPVAAMAAFAVGIKPLMGGGAIVPPYFEQTGFAIALVLLAAAAFYESRPILWAVCLAIGFNMQSMYGIFALTFFAAAFAIGKIQDRDWKKWAVAFILFLALASPAIISGLRVMGNGDGNDALWLTASHAKSIKHLYPEAWGAEPFVRSAIILGALIGLLCWRGTRNLLKHAVVWSAIACAWLGYAFLAAYVFKSPPMLMFQPARATDLWLCFAVVAIISTLAITVERRVAEGSNWRIPVLLLCSAILIWRPWDGLLWYALAFVLAAFLLERFSFVVFANGDPARLTLLIIAGVIAIAVDLFRLDMLAGYSVEDAFLSRPPAAVETVSAWAEKNTPLNAVFLVHPTAAEWEIFRALSQRSIFTSWGEGSAINWDRSFVSKWAERLDAVGVNLAEHDKYYSLKDALNKAYGNLRDEDVMKLKTRFNVSYWIVPEERSSEFPIAFATPEYKVLKIEK